MKTLLLCASAALLTLGLNTTATAETVKVYVGDQQAQGVVNKPKVGTTKQQVQKQFGQPKAKKGAVGQPPISSWQYDGFTVYFEYSHVVHAVTKR